jgi:hypothetical protein
MEVEEINQEEIKKAKAGHAELWNKPWQNQPQPLPSSVDSMY